MQVESRQEVEKYRLTEEEPELEHNSCPDHEKATEEQMKGRASGLIVFVLMGVSSSNGLAFYLFAMNR